MTKKQHAQAKIAIDPVMFTIIDQKLHVFLHKREKEPDKGLLELPGALLLPTETAEESLKRKVTALTGNKEVFLKQFHTFTNPNRDPRIRTVSIGFIALLPEHSIDDISCWYAVQSLPELAFDHKHIVEEARHFLKKNSNLELVKQFMPEKFPLNQLQKVYEVIEQTTYDNRNFRKKMISSAIVKETDEYEQNASHRPAKLFVFQ